MCVPFFNCSLHAVLSLKYPRTMAAVLVLFMWQMIRVRSLVSHRSRQVFETQAPKLSQTTIQRISRQRMKYSTLTQARDNTSMRKNNQSNFTTNFCYQQTKILLCHSKVKQSWFLILIRVWVTSVRGLVFRFRYATTLDITSQ